MSVIVGVVLVVPLAAASLFVWAMIRINDVVGPMPSPKGDDHPTD